MKVRRITPDGDWKFGKGRADYVSKSDAIKQSVITRLRSFANDWFLDTSHGVDWVGLLGSRGTTLRELSREVEKTVLTTTGVRSIEKLEVIPSRDSRSVDIRLSYTDLFDQLNFVSDTI